MKVIGLSFVLCALVSLACSTGISSSEIADSRSARPADSLSSDSVAASQTGDEEMPIWSGKSKGFHLMWSNQDLTYGTQGNMESLFRWLAQEELKAICEISGTLETKCGCLKPDSGICSNTWDFRVLSVVGSIVSFEQVYTGVGGSMRDSREKKYVVVDLSKPRRPIAAIKDQETIANDSDFLVRLDELFDARNIVRELLKNEDVIGALKEKDIDIADIRSLDDVSKLIEKFDGLPFALHDSVITKDFLTRFAVYDYRDNKVVVSLGFSAARDGHALKEITLELSTPPKLANSLDAASHQNEGFLMKDSQPRFDGRSTTIKYQF